MTRRARALLTLAGGVLLLTGPARADWLLLRDGSRVETRGPWELRGQLVVFETARGALSSLRLGEVDLAASRAATAEAAEQAKRPAPAAAPAPRRPVATITNADLAPGVAPPPADEAPPSEDATKPAEAGTATEGGTEKTSVALLEVVEWRQELDPSGADVIVGTLRSISQRVVGGATLEVVLYGVDGKVAASGRAFLADDLLQPGQTVEFRYPIASSVAFDRVELVPGGRPVALLVGDTPRKPPKEQR